MNSRLDWLTQAFRRLLDALHRQRKTPVPAVPNAGSYTQNLPEIKPDREEISQKDSVPLTLRVAADWSWRLLVVAVAFAGFLYVASKFQVIVIPVAVALLLSVLLEPALRVLYVNCICLGHWPPPSL